MEANTNIMTNLELFEELNDQVSEKISGGASIDALLKELADAQILDSSLQKRIDQKIKEIFPQGLGDAASLACATQNGHFKCEVSSNGQTKSFKVPL